MNVTWAFGIGSNRTFCYFGFFSLRGAERDTRLRTDMYRYRYSYVFESSILFSFSLMLWGVARDTLAAIEIGMYWIDSRSKSSLDVFDSSCG